MSNQPTASQSFVENEADRTSKPIDKEKGETSIKGADVATVVENPKEVLQNETNFKENPDEVIQNGTNFKGIGEKIVTENPDEIILNETNFKGTDVTMVVENPDEVILNEAIANDEETTPPKVDNKSCKSGASTEILCRICFDASKQEELATPCCCKGSIGKVHMSCLEHWLGTNNAYSCELCGYRFNTLRNPKYEVLQSVLKWYCSESGYSDSACMTLFLFFVLTPVVGIVIYCCVAIATCYAPKGDDLSSSATWIAVSLILATNILAVTYFCWFSVLIRRYGRRWFRWWQSQNQVRIIPTAPPGDGDDTTDGISA